MTSSPMLFLGCVPDGLYVVTTQRELKRLEASTEWYSLSRGITSLSIDTDGVVQARDIRGHKSLFYSFHTAPALDPVVGEGDDIFCTDVPSDDQVLWVAGLTGQTGLRVVVTPLVDQLDSPRIFPSGGPNHWHHCHYRCDLFDARGRKLGLSVYLDLDHLVRWAGGLEALTPGLQSVELVSVPRPILHNSVRNHV